MGRRAITYVIKHGYRREVDRSFVQSSMPARSSYTIDYSQYYTAYSTFRENTDHAVLQAIDRETGVIFDRVCQGGRLSSGNLPTLCSEPNDLCYRVVPSSHLEAAATSRHADGALLPRPSLILTLPTPVVPQSPVFVPQSPITVSKFFDALEPDAAPTERRRARTTLALAPSLESCGACGLAAFEQGVQCRACDRRWLACKVWYRAQDGGRRRWLSAPYVRPAESTAQTRALMHGLGLPGCDEGCAGDAGDTGRGAGALAYERAVRLPARDRLTLRRVRRRVRAGAVRARRAFHAIFDNPSSATTKGNKQPSAGAARLLHPMQRVGSNAAKTVGATRLGTLWTTLAGAWRARVQAAVDAGHAWKARAVRRGV